MLLGTSTGSHHSLTVSLCFITEGHCLSCYECDSMMGSCADQKVITCGSGSQCISSTKVIQFCKSSLMDSNLFFVCFFINDLLIHI